MPDDDSADDGEQHDIDLSQFQVTLAVRAGGRGLNIQLDGENAEILALDLRDRFYRCVQALENGGVPAEQDGHDYGYDWKRKAVATNGDPREDGDE